MRGRGVMALCVVCVLGGGVTAWERVRQVGQGLWASGARSVGGVSVRSEADGG